MDRDGPAIQAGQYARPYHHIPSHVNGPFCQTPTLSWGYEHLSYLDFVVARIGDLAPSSLLDVGCRDGRLLGMLYRLYLRRYLRASEDDGARIFTHCRAR